MKGLLREGRKRNVGSGSGRRKEMMIAVFSNSKQLLMYDQKQEFLIF